MSEIDISVEFSRWSELPAADKIVRGAIESALAASEIEGVEVSVMLADDARIRELNRTWLGKDNATNVLSFPSPIGPDDKVRFLGDIALAFETIEHEAADEGKSFGDHVAHLAVHGVLHLLGYDHEDESEAEAMERRERTILAQLGIADPYAPAARRTVSA